ncbi:Os10g0459900 [Oryza sativa Japonica Group]|jgi:hypothetical protein|uniref:Os10g0459900 protein n=3 Tax=Oryza sativa subsp. japonica TaxID=39947 RepID=B9G643_ORYSJ|nr:hypothetical protein OsJ_31793 [Oryza sativa Japonica Group]BAT11162.1 Os10g0459900 [Oryza sativa Japonica Group]
MREGGERTVILVLHAADLVGQRRKEDCRAQRGSSPAADGEKGAPLSLAAQPASVVPHHPTRVHRPSPSSSAPTARSTHSVPRRARSRRFNAAATEWMGIRPEEEEGRRSSCRAASICGGQKRRRRGGARAAPPTSTVELLICRWRRRRMGRPVSALLLRPSVPSSPSAEPLHAAAIVRRAAQRGISPAAQEEEGEARRPENRGGVRAEMEKRAGGLGGDQTEDMGERNDFFLCGSYLRLHSNVRLVINIILLVSSSYVAALAP